MMGKMIIKMLEMLFYKSTRNHGIAIIYIQDYREIKLSFAHVA